MNTTTPLLFCAALIAALVTAGCGGGGDDPTSDGGLGRDVSVPPDGGGAGYLALGDSQTATVRDGVDEYRTGDLAPGQYALVLTNESDSVTGSVYLASGALLTDGCVDGGCLFDHAGGSLRIVVDSIFDTSEFYRVSLVRLETFGSETEPLLVPLATEFETATPASGVSYFSFEVTRAGTHFLRVTSHWGELLSGDMHLEIFAEADFGTERVRLCEYSGSEACQLTGIATGVYGIRATEIAGAPAAYDWIVTQGLGEGAPSERVPLTRGVAHAGAIDSFGDSYYEFVTGSEAGGVVVDLADINATVTFQVRDPATGDSLQTCSGTCEVSGLSASTLYWLDMESFNFGTTYTVTAMDGTAVGAPLAPVDFPLGQDVLIQLQVRGVSYYRLRVPIAGSYYFLFGEPATDTGDIQLELDGSPVWSTFGPTAGECDAIGCVWSVEANHDYLFEVTGPGAVNRTLRVEKASYGNGSWANPIPMVIGETRPVDVRSVYSVTTSATDLPTLVAAFDQLGADISFGTGAAISRSCSSNGNYARRCALGNFEPNREYVFTVTAPADSGARFGVFRVDASLGCPPEAARCDAYEGGTPPPDYTEPSDSDGPWQVNAGSAITGSYGFRAPSAGNIGLSCFEVTRTQPSWALLFSSTTNALAPTPAPRVYIDGVLTFPEGAGSAGTRWRWVVNTVLGPNHVYRICYNAGAQATAVDDLSFF